MIPNTPYQQGIAHYKAGDYQTGLARFTEAINQNYQPLEAAYYERSKCYEALGRVDKAQADLAQILTFTSDNYWQAQAQITLNLLQHVNSNVAPNHETTVVYDYDPLRRPTIKGIIYNFLPGFICIIVFMFFTLLTSELYNKTRLLQESPQLVQGQVTRKLVGQDKKETRYAIDYTYTVRLADGHDHEFADNSPVSAEVYSATGETVAIIYLANDPYTSRIKADFNPSEEYWWAMSLFGVGTLFLVVGLRMVWYNLSCMKLVQQIVDKGRITQAVVHHKKHYQTKYTSYYNVYYHYYCYVGHFNSAVAFNVLNVGDTIKVGYLPDKPHISKPFYNDLLLPASPNGCVAFMGLAMAGVLASTLFGVAIFSIMSVFTPINQPDLDGWVLCLSPIITLIVSTLLGRRMGRVGSSSGGVAGLLAGFVGYFLFGWCTLGFLIGLIKNHLP